VTWRRTVERPSIPRSARSRSRIRSSGPSSPAASRRIADLRVAARYTDDRQDNFDIYLPLWLARYNKQVFGALFVIGAAYALWAWSAQ
jgi:hypothetical protein